MTPGTCLCSVFKGCCTSLLNKSEKLKIEKWALYHPKQREENCSPYHLFQLSIEGRVDLKTQATKNNFSLIVNVAILEIMWSFSNSEDTRVRKIGRKQGEFLLFLSNVDKPLSLSFGFLRKEQMQIWCYRSNLCCDEREWWQRLGWVRTHRNYLDKECNSNQEFLVERKLESKEAFVEPP